MTAPATFEFPEYPKIYGPYDRDTSSGPNRNKVIPGQWSRPEFEALADTPWVWTEKVDGTNIRVGWDGHKVHFGGRTDNAQIPVKLLDHLLTTFPEELFEQQFGSDHVVLYGEGHGAGIQKGGGRYAAAPSFVLFDIRIGRFWLLRNAVVDIANNLGIGFVPQVYVGNVFHAIDIVGRSLTSQWDGGSFLAEGVVGTPALSLIHI